MSCFFFEFTRSNYKIVCGKEILVHVVELLAHFSTALFLQFTLRDYEQPLFLCESFEISGHLIGAEQAACERGMSP